MKRFLAGFLGLLIFLTVLALVLSSPNQKISSEQAENFLAEYSAILKDLMKDYSVESEEETLSDIIYGHTEKSRGKQWNYYSCVNEGIFFEVNLAVKFDRKYMSYSIGYTYFGDNESSPPNEEEMRERILGLVNSISNYIFSEEEYTEFLADDSIIEIRNDGICKEKFIDCDKEIGFYYDKLFFDEEEVADDYVESFFVNGITKDLV